MFHDRNEIERIRSSLNQGMVHRNAKTLIILIIAASGIIFGQSALAVTTFGTLVSLAIARTMKAREHSPPSKND